MLAAFWSKSLATVNGIYRLDFFDGVEKETLKMFDVTVVELVDKLVIGLLLVGN